MWTPSRRTAPARRWATRSRRTLGDPIEAQALLATYGREQPSGQTLWLGSVKSNIGHTQAAAGVAGIIKMVQAMHHGELPRTLHVDEPSAHVDWDAGAVSLLTESVAWPRNGRPRRAAVSSFGVSGTNAHVVLEEAEAAVEAATPAAPESGALLWPLSAKTPAALADQAARLADHLNRHPDVAAHEVARALATTRSAFEHRAVVLGTGEALLTGLAALAERRETADVIRGVAREGRPVTTAFLFSGQGSQRAGMGRELYAAFPVFAHALDEACTELDRHLDQPLRPIMFAEPGTPQAELLDQTHYAQPALFALHTAQFRLLAHWNIHPQHLTGHSLGELSAAHCAGILTLPDAATLITARARLMQTMPTNGTMTALHATEEEITPHLTPHVSIAALNSPTETVISGDTDTVHTITTHFREQGRKTTDLRVSHAFHSPHMDGMLDQFAQIAATLTYHPPTTPLTTNTTGDPTTPHYWTHHVRDTVRFHDGLHTLHTHHVTTTLELGPGTTLTTLAHHTLNPEGSHLPTLRRGQPEARSLLNAVGALHAAGSATPDWQSLIPEAEPVDLPTYPFQRQRLWLDAAPRHAAEGTHPFLSTEVDLADGDGLVLSGRLGLDTHPWLADHTVNGTVLVPGTALLELALHAAERTGHHTGLHELTLQAPLTLDGTSSRRLQITISDSTGGEEDSRVTVYSRPDSAAPGAWTRHATGTLTARSTAPAAAPAV
ncbi:hypothetical protein N566_17845, partial [Streptomycetaceae bacterium MP113-05]